MQIPLNKFACKFHGTLWMGQKVIIRLWWESGLSSASRNHLTTFCRRRPSVHYACLRLCSAVVLFIWNNCLYFVCWGWSARALTALATLPISVVWQNCCTSSKTADFNIEAFRHFIMSQQGKRKPKVSWTSIHNEKLKVFLSSLCAFSILV